MSNQDFLLEIGVEEMPARFVRQSMEQLQTKLEQWLGEHSLTYAHIAAFATPRRLSVLVKGLAERQADREEEVKGPAKKIALDDAGNWTKAAQGFARSQGVSVDDLIFKEQKGVEYVYAHKQIKGLETEQLLPQLEELIKGLTFPKQMRWGSHTLRFVRPLKWLVALYGQTVIPLEITGVMADRYTEGHRFLSGSIRLDQPGEYVEVLRDNFVIVNMEERKHMIVEQLQAIEKENGWTVPIDQALLEEVTQLVEYPTALYGSFDKEFLDIPSEVLITSMKEHQRYFPVTDERGRLLPHFITIRNGQEDSEGLVVRGNEKVIRARLADARFFYEEDKKLKIDTALSQLEQIVFQEELGSIGDKVRRVKQLALHVASAVQLDEQARQSLERAAEICKFDLVTQMVGEFPELQGIMGEKYAGLAGEDEEVSKAVREHYLPRFAGDKLPTQQISSILSIADKMDTIAGCFGIGIQPTGSQDPYALRRQATGIVQIILAENWPITLAQLFSLTLSVLRQANLLKEDEQKIIRDLEQFFFLRLKNKLQEEGIRYDLIEAVLVDYANTSLVAIVTKANLLMKEMKKETFKPLVEAFTRVNNLAIKLEERDRPVKEALFEGASEQTLFDIYDIVNKDYTVHAQAGQWEEAFQALIQLQEPIDQFFEETMVMVDKEELRLNRLALLQKVSQLLHRFADFSQIVFSSK